MSLAEELMPGGADSRSRRRTASLWVLPAAVLLLVLLSGVLADRLVADRAARDARVDVLQELGTLRARLEGAITGNLQLASGLVAYIQVDPDLTQEDFARIAAAIFRQGSGLRHVGAARDLIVTHIHPVAGNEAAIGMDYRRNAAQRAAVLRARDTRSLVVDGPLELVQGGSALIGRVPVFLDEDGGAFWGIVSAVIDMEALYAAAGLFADELALDIALRAPGASLASEGTFFGDAALFDGDGVLLEVSLPGRAWELAGRPRAGWDDAPAHVWVVRTATAMLLLVVFLLFVVRHRHLAERARSNAALRASRERLMDAIGSIRDGFVLWDADDRLVLCNRRYLEMYADAAKYLRPGVAFGDLLQFALEEGLLQLDSDPGQWLADRVDAQRRGNRRLELRLRDGRYIEVDERRTSNDGVVGIHTDVTEIRRAEQDIRFRAYFDPLTALPNRTRFLEQLDDAIGHAVHGRTQMAVLFVDLDRFKNVNDTLGHDVGDQLLRAAGNRIRRAIRANDVVARLGGDEFTVILHEVDEMQATTVAEQIIARLTRDPFVLDGHEIYSGASVGITVCPHDGSDATVLMRNADMAMYHAKEIGGNTFHYFTSEMTERAQRFVAMEKDLRRALEEGQFEVYLQPVMDLATGRAAGAEALLRWQHPERGTVMPGEFIPVAEKSGLIAGIGLWVLEAACRLCADWDEAGFVSVNVSSRQFKAGFGLEVVDRILAETGFAGERLVFEITESLLLEDDDRVGRALQDFRERGIHLAIDDFGTGYSSLSYLRRFPVSRLKIDRAFVMDMDSDRADARLVESIIAMARALDLTAIAEGVETAAQAELLRRLGCPMAQGYLYARPMPAAQFPRWLATRDAAPQDQAGEGRRGAPSAA